MEVREVQCHVASAYENRMQVGAKAPYRLQTSHKQEEAIVAPRACPNMFAYLVASSSVFS